MKKLRNGIALKAGTAMLTLIALVPSPGLGQTMEEAEVAYREGKYAVAVQVFQMHAKRHNARAQYKLGQMYQKGHGVEKDGKQAVRWFREAAMQGHAKAELALGYMYASGQDIEEDDAEAVQWFRRAAEHGDAEAQYQLGAMYANAWEVARDGAEAMRWFHAAAAQGDSLAQYTLGMMYESGAGVPQDFIQAHKWYNLAASRTYVGESWHNEMVRARNQLASRMTESDLSEAQRLAREWIPRRTTNE